MNRRTVLKLAVLFLPDFLLLAYFLTLMFLRNAELPVIARHVLPPLVCFIVIKTVLFMRVSRSYFEKIRFISKMVNDYKKGKYSPPKNTLNGDDMLDSVFRDLTVMGKNFDDIVSAQKTEIEQLREMYNNIVLSMSSYFIVLNEREEIIFGNESFCHKFNFEQEDIYGKNLDSLFVFLTGVIKKGIESLRESARPVILEKTHLLSKNGISIIADIKISSIKVQGRNQTVIIIDDITNRCRKDYQITLISQISESIQRDEEIDNVLYTILTGITSGSGLGFNRAMLFLVDDDERLLAGRMAVGPDSLEEAIDIWNSIPAGSVEVFMQLKNYSSQERKGKLLLEKVLAVRIPLDTDNVLVEAMRNVEHVHVYDALRDERIHDDLRELMDVKEFVIVPLVSVNRAIGVIVADNRFNQMPIGNDSIELLTIFAFQAALSIESYRNLSILKKEMRKITDRQEAIVESEKLAAVGRIATHIAHEIRNPLVTMGGYAGRIAQLSRDTEKNSAMIQNAAAVIMKESERLEKVLSNVMDFTRPSPYIREYNNINDVITDTVDLLKNLLQERKITIKLSLSRDLPLVKSDFNQMKQVMLNLVQNAIDATVSRGEIEVATSAQEHCVDIIVRDTGSGIREDDPNRVFEPFFTTKVTGVGLGLAIVKKIVNDHGGDINVRNRPEGGTEFKISLNIPA